MLNHLTKRPIRHERGQALVATTCLIVALIGFAALATDIGYMYSVRRHMQSAADAASLAAANQAYLGGDNASAIDAADDVASLNGFTSTNSTINVTSTTTPPAGAPSGATYYTVQITQNVPTFFLKVLGYNTMTISTQAAEAGAVPDGGVVAGTSASGSGVTVDSGASVTVAPSGATQQGACGVVSNAGLTNKGTITAPSIGVVGSVTGTTPAHTTTGIAPVGDEVAPCVAKAISGGGIAANTCTIAATTKTGTKTISTSTTITPQVYSGSGSSSSTPCGYVCASGTGAHGSLTPVSITFNTAGGTCGNRISCGANDQTSNPIANSTVTLNPGTYQCSTSHGFGWGGSTSTCSLEVGNNASGCTVTCNSGGSYTFIGNVSCSGSNTINLQPGTYCGGITVTGTSGAAPTVNFAPGTYYIGGGGLNCTGTCTLNGTGCTFYNTSDPSSLGLSNGPISIGPNSTDNVTCSLHAPTSGTCKGLLLCQDSSISGSSGSGWSRSGGSGSTSKCSVQGCSGSTFDGCVYTPGASLKYCGSSSPSSSHGYTIVSADSVELTSGAAVSVSCDYGGLANSTSPITTAALYK